jgi:tetratricopeptide (TPR) repeat protein
MKEPWSAPRTKLKWMLLLAIGAICFGCRLSSPPDPNDPKNAPPDELAKTLRKNLQTAADDLNQRVIARQMSDAERNRLLAEKAKELLAQGDPKHCAPKDAWIYADLMLTEKDYADAIPLLKTAVKYAESVKDDDRRVNDSFRLARAMAQLGQIEPALTLAQSIISSKPADPGPVLPSVLLQLAPLTEGKGHDEQLAKLLEEAIHEHLREKVDPTSDAGKMFLAAKPYHIHRAWDKIVILLYNSGHPDQAKAAQAKEDAMMKTLAPEHVYT